MTKILQSAAKKGKPRKPREEFAARNKALQGICNDYESFGSDKLFFLESIVANLSFNPVDRDDPVVDHVDPVDLAVPIDSVVSEDNDDNDV